MTMTEARNGNGRGNGHSVGYIRVSTSGQHTGRQLEGVELDKVFTEKVSGKDRDRPQLQACIEYVREGDVLHVHSLDRLGRSLQDLQKIVSQLVDKGVTVQFHKENLTFNKENNGSMGKLLFQILGAFAEFERNLVKERQAEGIAQAKAEGRHLGRSPKLTKDQKIKLYEYYKNRNETNESISSLAKRFNISRATVHNVINEFD